MKTKKWCGTRNEKRSDIAETCSAGVVECSVIPRVFLAVHTGGTVKLVEGQAIELEDGTMAYVQNASKRELKRTYGVKSASNHHPNWSDSCFYCCFSK